LIRRAPPQSSHFEPPPSGAARGIRALPHLDFVDLRLFLNVASAKNLTRGAELSALSLAAASMRLKKLEEVLGATLLNRSKRGTSLTPAGEALMRHARLILQQVDRMGAEMRQFGRGLKSQVRLFANTTAITDFLPKALSAFLAAHPDVDIDLREFPSAEVVRAVVEGAAELGIVSGHVSSDGLETLPYYVDRLVLATPPGHPLARLDSVGFAQALEYDFVGRNAGSALHAFMTDVVRNYPLRQKLRIQVGNFEEMARLIEVGIGVGVMPISAVQRQRPAHDIRAVRIADNWSVQSLKICVRDRNGLPDVARDLIDFLAADAEGAAQEDRS
jgi:DNA-binding transcriptional LysR family regulator